MRRHIRTIVVVLIGAALMAFALRGADLGRVGDAVLAVSVVVLVSLRDRWLSR